MSRSRYTLLIDSLIHWLILKKIRDNFRLYLERAHPAFLTTLVVFVFVKVLTITCQRTRFSRAMNLMLGMFPMHLVVLEAISDPLTSCELCCNGNHSSQYSPLIPRTPELWVYFPCVRRRRSPRSLICYFPPPVPPPPSVWAKCYTDFCREFAEVFYRNPFWRILHCWGHVDHVPEVTLSRVYHANDLSVFQCLTLVQFWFVPLGWISLWDQLLKIEVNEFKIPILILV